MYANHLSQFYASLICLCVVTNKGWLLQTDHVLVKDSKLFIVKILNWSL